jgi:hypothetical protein
MSNAHAGLSRQRAEIGLSGLYGELAGVWQNAKVRVLAQVLFLLGMSGLAALAKSVGLPLGIPGSNGMLWVAPLVAGYAVVNKRGSGILMGGTMALWGVPFGIHHELIYNSCLYGITGLALDVAAALPFINIRHPFGAIFCGLIAHMAKFGFITEAAMFSGVAKNFVIIGLGKSAVLHITFGGVAGFLAWIGWDTLRRNSKKGPDSRRAEQEG